MLSRLRFGGLVCTLSLAGGIASQEEGGIPDRWADELPIVEGASGPVPVKETLAFAVRADGRIEHEGRRLSITQLRTRLAAFAKLYPEEGTHSAGLKGKVSRAQVVLRLHPRLPFAVFSRLLQVCAAPEVRIYRMFFSVRPETGGPERAVALFLPVDHGEEELGWTLEVRMRYSLPSTDATILADRLANVEKHGSRLPGLHFLAEGHTAVGSVVRTAYAARRAGFDRIGFSATARRSPRGAKGRDDLVALVAMSRPRPASEPGIQLIGPMRDIGTEEIEEVMEEEEEVVEEIVEEVKPATPSKTPDAYGNRKRSRTARKGRTHNAIRRALDWLVDHQDRDGKWDCDAFMKHDTAGQPCDGAGNPVHDVGVTGLALLALLGDGSTMRTGRYKDSIKRAVKWLREQQSPNGLFGVAASHDFIYDHAIATYAMCEAYGLSQYKTIKRNAQRGIDYLESHRNPYGCWRYQPRDNDNDSSVTSWCIMAYQAASDFGLNVDRTAIKIARTFLDELTDPVSGRCGYTKRGELSSRHPGDHSRRFPIERCETLTAAGLFARFRLGQSPKKVPVMRRAATTILARRPRWDESGGIDFYYWYYASHALFQMGGTYWNQWKQDQIPVALDNQRSDGNAAGSWNPVSTWSEDGGRVYSTAMLALTLEAPFRFVRKR